MITPTVKMIFTFALASALAVSAVLGRSSSPSSRYVTYETEDQTIKQSDETAQIMVVGDRSSNLKYVMAIQSSSIWEEIKKRSLTLHSAQKLDGTVDENSPDDLTDQELAQLKQACHDGLKCVAVDQLMVLEQVKEQLVGGKVSVRTVITKITQVLSQYTTEYHEDVYQYEAVSESDDQSKVNESVTTIVEDNRELCRIDFTPPKQESYSKKVDGNSVSAAAKNITNYNTINNFNINNGTINSATINVKPNSEATTEEPTKIESKNRSPNQQDVNADYQSMPLAKVNSTPAVGDKSDTKAPKNDVPFKSNTVHHPEYAQSTGDHRKPLPTNTDGPSPRDGSSAADIGTDNSGRGRKAQPSSPDVTGRTNSGKTDEPAAGNKIVLNRANGIDASDHTEKTATDRAANNTVKIDNGTGSNSGGKNRTDSGIVSAGSHNANVTKNGMTKDGILNNGNMKVKTVDNSNLNKGTIKDAKAGHGIINVGTINNGPTNYGDSENYINNGTFKDISNNDILQYVDNINDMYSTILNKFAKN